LYNFFLL